MRLRVLCLLRGKRCALYGVVGVINVLDRAENRRAELPVIQIYFIIKRLLRGYESREGGVDAGLRALQGRIQTVLHIGLETVVGMLRGADLDRAGIGRCRHCGFLLGNLLIETGGVKNGDDIALFDIIAFFHRDFGDLNARDSGHDAAGIYGRSRSGKGMVGDNVALRNGVFQINVSRGLFRLPDKEAEDGCGCARDDEPFDQLFTAFFALFTVLSVSCASGGRRLRSCLLRVRNRSRLRSRLLCVRKGGRFLRSRFLRAGGCCFTDGFAAARVHVLESDFFLFVILCIHK